MADSTSIIMELQNQEGKKTSKSITDVDPNATNGDIKAFTTGMNALTNNTLGNITKVDKTTIDKTLTYVDTALTFIKDNDPNNAITIEGNIITVDYTKVVDTEILSQQTNIMITPENTRPALLDFNVKFEQSDITSIASIFTAATGIGIALIKPNNPPQDFEITFAGVKSGSKYYNPVTVYIRKAV